mmetsp:Transcript_28694/g.95263  ORF Transcript_28694/g.95263 Transcript_28694/m.95263 type:complete len:215 (-) Transcript_28694:1948-2592(-)
MPASSSSVRLPVRRSTVRLKARRVAALGVHLQKAQRPSEGTYRRPGRSWPYQRPRQDAQARFLQRPQALWSARNGFSSKHRLQVSAKRPFRPSVNSAITATTFRTGLPAQTKASGWVSATVENSSLCPIQSLKSPMRSKSNFREDSLKPKQAMSVGFCSRSCESSISMICVPFSLFNVHGAHTKPSTRDAAVGAQNRLPHETQATTAAGSLLRQ